MQFPGTIDHICCSCDMACHLVRNERLFWGVNLIPELAHLKINSMLMWEDFTMSEVRLTVFSFLWCFMYLVSIYCQELLYSTMLKRRMSWMIKLTKALSISFLSPKKQH